MPQEVLLVTALHPANESILPGTIHLAHCYTIWLTSHTDTSGVCLLPCSSVRKTSITGVRLERLAATATTFEP